MSIAIPALSTLEQEPNDAIDQAQFLEGLATDERLQVFGNTAGGGDVFDSFFLVPLDRMEITPRIELDRGDPSGVILRIYDPIAGQFVESIPLDGSTSFHAKGPFYAVLESSLLQGSNYVLSFDPVSAGELIDEKRFENGELGAGQYLGEILVDEGQRVSGILDSTEDVDRYVVVIPQRASVATSAIFSGTAVHNIDLDVNDVTRDLFDPLSLANFETSGPAIEAGSFDVGDFTALEIVVRWSLPPVIDEGDDRPSDGSLDSRRPINDGPPPLPPGPDRLAYELNLSAAASLSRVAAGGARFGTRQASPEQESQVVRASQAFGQPTAPAMDGYVIVKPNGDESATIEFLEGRGYQVEKMKGLGALKAHYSADSGMSLTDRRRLTQRVSASLHGSSSVKWASADRMAFSTRLPNDALLGNQNWHYNQINAPEAWDISVGENNVVVAVIDSGSEAHPDIEQRWFEGFDFVDLVENSLDGDGVDDDPTDVTRSLHGLHVAGTVGAASNNGEGVAGMMWSGRIMPLRVFGVFEFPDGSTGNSALDSWVANAILYAAGKESPAPSPPSQAAHVINMSLRALGEMPLTEQAINSALATGVTVVAGAGNDEQNIPVWPAVYDGVISVSATNEDRELAFYSNYHSSVDITAPGGDFIFDEDNNFVDRGVWSTYGRYNNDTFVPDYAPNMGTSMASPHVAGVAGLMKSVYPEALPHEIEAILYGTATDIGAKGKDENFGHGLVNTFLAVKTAKGESGAPILRLERDTVDLSPGQNSASIALFNEGTGLLLVDEPVADTETGEPWLQVQAVASQDANDPTDKRALLIDVSRDGLSPGIYRGTVEVNTLNAGEAKIRVHMMVEPPVSLGGDVDVFVVAVDAETGEPRARTTVNPEGGLDYDLGNLPTGQYRFFAGSDDDGDEQIGGPGDRFFGAHDGIVTVNGGTSLDLRVSADESVGRQSISLAVR